MSLSTRLQKVVDFVRSQRSPPDKDSSTASSSLSASDGGSGNNSNTTTPKLPFVYPTPQETTEKFLQLLLGKLSLTYFTHVQSFPLHYTVLTT